MYIKPSYVTIVTKSSYTLHFTSLNEHRLKAKCTLYKLNMIGIVPIAVRIPNVLQNHVYPSQNLSQFVIADTRVLHSNYRPTHHSGRDNSLARVPSHMPDRPRIRSQLSSASSSVQFTGGITDSAAAAAANASDSQSE